MTEDDRPTPPVDRNLRGGAAPDPLIRQELTDDGFLRDLLGSLDDDFPEVPEALPDRTIRKVQAELTSRDLLDLTTFVFLMRFSAPLLDLLAAFFGHDPVVSQNRSQAQPPESQSTPRDPARGGERRDPYE